MLLNVSVMRSLPLLCGIPFHDYHNLLPPQSLDIWVISRSRLLHIMVLRTFLYVCPHGLALTFAGYAPVSGNTEPEDMDVSNRVYNGKWFSKVDVSFYTLYSGVYKFLLFPSSLSLLCFPKGFRFGSLRYLDPISGEAESRVLVGSS